jgi:hypothetical protein
LRAARAAPDPVARALLLTLTLPRIHERMTTARIEAVHAAAGAWLAYGAKLVDLTVDLSAGAEQDCPPLSHYRIVLLDRGWLRELRIARGDEVGVGARMAMLSSTPDEPLDAAPTRAVRTSIAGIMLTAPRAGGDVD